MSESLTQSEATTNPEATPSAESIAIVGIGCLFPKADGAQAFWSNIKRGVDAITPIPDSHWKPEQYFDGDPSKPDMTYAKRGGFLDPVDFNPLHHGIAPNNIEATDTTQLLGLVVAEQALRDAGYETGRGAGDGRPFNRDRTSVILGVTGTLELVIPLGARLGHPIWRKALEEAGVDKSTADDVVERIADGYVPWQENSFPGLLGNVAAGRIANRFDLGGSNCVVDAACASSLSAVHMAAMELQTGRADMVLTGGLDTFNDIFMYMCFSKTPALSPTGDAKPFSADGDGTILGEGLGIVVLKRLADAERDGDRIYAVIKGIGSSSDGKGNAIYAPSAAGQVKCLTNAYREAGVSPRTIELVEAHGTGTKVGDATEIKALRQVYEAASATSPLRERSAESARPGEGDSSSRYAALTSPPSPSEGEVTAPWLAVGSVKSMIGHTKAAAGVAGLIKAALALDKQVLPPTIKVSQPLDVAKPGDSPVFLNTERRPWLPRRHHPRRAAVSAFGFGGSNFHCVLEEAARAGVSGPGASDAHGASENDFDFSGNIAILPISAETVESLRAALNTLTPLAARPWNELRARSASLRAAFDHPKPHRLVLVIERDRTDLAKLIASAERQFAGAGPQGPARFATPDGAFYASGMPGKLAFLFPGQGSQYVGMLRDLACDSAIVREAVAAANDAFGENDRGERLSDRVYPIPVFDDAARDRLEAALRDTRVAQPAIGAVSLGSLRLLEHFGLHADAAGGHSFGELVALHAAGCIDDESVHRLAITRGRLMADAGADRSDRGAMLAVAAPIAQVESLLRETKLDIVVANHNAPNQVVLSGATAAIDSMATACERRGLRAKKLPVAAAFHSSFVADAEPRFAQALRSVSFAPATAPVFANSTASPYPAESDAAKALLAGQLAKPVHFTGMIEGMHAAGVRTFIEVGPKATLTALVKSILGERDHVAIALDASIGKRTGEYDLALVLAQAAALGHAVDLKRWDAAFKLPESTSVLRKPAMTVRLTGANYVKPRPARPPRRPAANAAADVAPTTNTPKAVAATPPMTAPPRVSAPSTGVTRPGSQTGRVTPQVPAIPTPAPVPAAAMPASPAPAPSPATPPRPLPVNTPTPNPSQLAHALQITQQNILALQRTQEQLAQLHRQYLAGQDASQRTLTQLIEQQNQLLAASLGQPVSFAPLSPAPLAAPVPQFALAPFPPIAPAPQPSYESQPSPTFIAPPVAAPVIASTAPAPAPTIAPPRAHAQPTVPARSGSQPARTSPPASAAHPSSPSVKASSDDRAKTALLAVVADKTGYPVEMLELSMSLDADLGIDSIKRVEILSALQERLPDAPIVKPEDLGSLQTLGQIVAFLSGARADDAAPTLSPSRPAEATSSSDPSEDASRVQSTLLAVVADKTGYPVEMLELSMSLDADLGIDSIKRVEILSAIQERLPDAPVVKPEDLGSLQTLGQIVAFLAGGESTELAAVGAGDAHKKKVDEAQSQADSNCRDASADVVRQVLSLQPIAGASLRRRLRLPSQKTVWITDDGDGVAAHLRAALGELSIDSAVVPIDADPASANLCGLIVLTPAKPDDDFVLRAFKSIQRCGPVLRRVHAETGQHVLLAAVTRLGGGFALDGATTGVEPISAALAGIVKTAHHEWPQISCKAIDLPSPVRHKSELSEDLVDELLREGPVEVAMHASGRLTPVLRTDPVPAGGAAPLNEGDVVVITGGARGVTAEVAVALAREYGVTLALIGRSTAPSPEPAWLNGLADDAAIKRAIAAHLAGATPKLVEQEFRRVVANREVLRTIERIEAAGGKAVYLSADVRDAGAMEQALAAARNKGPIRGIVHGAGVLADRLIDDKTDEQFRLVFGTKVDGFRALLDATSDDDLRVIVAFSSSTARFGRRGQVDYAAANEVLNKLAQQQAALRPGCRVVSVNWGPWDGGMVTPALKKVFEGEGVGVIGLEAGAQYLAREIATPAGGPVEIVILGPGTRTDEALDGSRLTFPDAAPTAESVQAAPILSVAFEREVSVDAIPVLRSHVLSGKAVLPMALMMEWLAYGAMHGNPGLAFKGIEDLRVFKGVKVDADKAVTLRVLAGDLRSEGDEHRVTVELRDGGTIHARATVVLAAQLPRGERAIELNLPPAPSKAVAAAYESGTLFHGPDLHAFTAITGSAPAGAAADAKAAPPPIAWMKQPIRSAWLLDPMALDAAFQLMIVWSTQQRTAPSLPTGLGRYTQFVRRFPAEGTRIAARIVRASDHEAAADIEFTDRAGNLIARIDGYTCVIDASLRDAFRLNQLTAGPALSTT